MGRTETEFLAFLEMFFDAGKQQQQKQDSSGGQGMMMTALAGK